MSPLHYEFVNAVKLTVSEKYESHFFFPNARSAFACCIYPGENSLAIGQATLRPREGFVFYVTVLCIV
jgi:hypothetical protein